MHRKLKAQRALFPDELPHWETLSHEQQDQVREVLSLLLEKCLREHSWTAQHPQHQNAENARV
jgi:hypothetical protein